MSDTTGQSGSPAFPTWGFLPVARSLYPVYQTYFSALRILGSRLRARDFQGSWLGFNHPLPMMSINELGGIPLRSIPPNLISTPKQIEQNRKKQLGRQSGHCTELKN